MHRRFTQVSDAQVEVDSGQGRPARADVEHAARGVDADHTGAVGRDRNGDPSGADAELHDRTAGPPRFLQVERDVLHDAPAPRVVELGDRVVVAHARFACMDWQEYTDTALRSFAEAGTATELAD